jgi:hypothetical protein
MDDGLAFAGMLEPLVDAFDVSAGNYDTAMTLLPMVTPGSLLTERIARKLTLNGIGPGSADRSCRRNPRSGSRTAETQMSSGQPTNNPIGKKTLH